jgi:hypothetical protein
MHLSLIPAGSFRMGSPRNEADRLSPEGPMHVVEITRPFHIGAHTVTQEQYQAVMGRNPSLFHSDDHDTRRFPVENVSWNDTERFCRRLGRLAAERAAGRSYRLPTEAEWEYACRAGASGHRPRTADGCRVVHPQRLGPVRHARQRLGVDRRLVRAMGRVRDRRPRSDRTDGRRVSHGPRRVVEQRRTGVPLRDPGMVRAHRNGQRDGLPRRLRVARGRPFSPLEATHWVMKFMPSTPSATLG